MAKTMLGKLFNGPLLDLMEKLSGEQKEEWYEALKRFLRKENPWAGVEKAGALLKLINTIELPAIDEVLELDKCFKVTLKGERKTSQLIIGQVGKNFREVVRGLVGPRTMGATIRVHELSRDSKDEQILAELGENARLGFSRMYQMLEKQGRGQKGDLSIGGSFNVFYIHGTGWAACCYWSTGYKQWHLDAYPITDLSKWHISTRIVSY